MTERIIRVRIRRAHVPETFPYAHAYLVPKERIDEIYPLFGVSFSAEHTSVLQHQFDYHYVDRELSPLRSVTVHPRISPCRVVVPLRVDAKGKPSPFYSLRHAPHPPLRDELYLDAALDRLRSALPAIDALLHLGPRKEDVVQMCTCCARLTDHLMDLCTPGLRECPSNMTIPVKHLYRKARHVQTRRP